MIKGEKHRAVIKYSKSIELNPGNENAILTVNRVIQKQDK